MEPAWLDQLDADDRQVLRAADHPLRIEPQLALTTSVPVPAGWLLERKLDGMRLLVHVHDGDVELRSRTGELRTGGFPELAEAARHAGGDDWVADGEVVAFDGEATSFGRLQGRIGLNDPVRALRTGIEVHLYLFDLLHLDGRDLRDLPLLSRKRLLRTCVRLEEPLRDAAESTGDPAALLEQACRDGWEGLIAKDPRAPYRSGRSSRWRKLKCSRRQELVVGGFTEPKGSRSGLGALLLGHHDASGLRYAGKVGTGFDERTLTELSRALRRIERADPPFVDPPRERATHWVEPLLVVEVVFGEWTRDGRLRHPRYVGVRLDRQPEDVVREESHDG